MRTITIYNFKSLMFISCFLICSLTLKSQPYIPMLNNNAEWHVTNCYMGCATDKYYTIGDTIINSYHYKFLDLFHYNKNFVIREDTVSRKIYMRLLADPSPSKEYLLYDFSLQVNDTISVTNPGSPYPKYAGSFILDSIKFKPLVNNSHRFFYLHSLDTLISSTKNTIWVEGIGSLCLINTPGAMPQINETGQLSCYFNNNINEYNQSNTIADCLSIYPVGINESDKPINYIINQDFDTKTITINSNTENSYQTIIYNIEGKIEYSDQNIHENNLKINIESFTKGMLLLKIITDNGYCNSSKILNP